MYWLGKTLTQENITFNSIEKCRSNDSNCLNDASEFLRGVYNFVGSNTLPQWEVVDSQDCAEQVEGHNSCAIHTAANAYLVAQNKQFTHTFDENVVESVRMYMLYQLSRLKTSQHVF